VVLEDGRALGEAVQVRRRDVVVTHPRSLAVRTEEVPAEAV
jgi:hypothetical protein